MEIVVQTSSDIKLMLQTFRDFELRGINVPKHLLLEEDLKDNLVSGKAAFYYTVEGKYITGFAFGSAIGDIFSSGYSRIKSVGKQDACLLSLVDYMYQDAKKKGSRFFRFTKDFEPSAELLEELEARGFELVERHLLAIYLNEYREKPAKLPKNFEFFYERPLMMDSIIEVIKSSFQDTKDAVIYPEYETGEKIRELHNLTTHGSNDDHRACTILQIIHGSEIVGIIIYDITDGKYASIEVAAVIPEYQKRGLGTNLLIETLNRIKEAGVEWVKTHVTSNTFGAKLLEQLGFNIEDYRWVIIKERGQSPGLQ